MMIPRANKHRLNAFFKLEQSIFLVTLGSAAWLVQELLGHVRVWMMLIEKLNGMES